MANDKMSLKVLLAVIVVLSITLVLISNADVKVDIHEIQVEKSTE